MYVNYKQKTILFDKKWELLFQVFSIYTDVKFV